MSDPIKPVVGVPMERVINQHAFYGFIAIANQGIPFLKLGYTRNDIARNRYARRFLETDFTHLVMLDSDHVHPHDIVQRLCRWFHQFEEPKIISGLNFRRGKPYDPVITIEGPDGSLYRPIEWEDGLQRVDLMGTGSIAIAREVFESMDPPWFGYDYVERAVERDRWPGTDIYFCKRAKEAGYELFVDTTTTSPHITDMFVDESTFRAYQEKHSERMGNKGNYDDVMGGWTIGGKCFEAIDELLEEGDTILELGSGEGSRALAEAYNVYSVEHDRDWFNRFENVNYIWASIVPNGGYDWYDAGQIERHRPEHYDLLLIDGPPGHIGRRGILEHLDLFDLDRHIVVDDVNREEEKSLLVELSEITGREFEIVRDGNKAFGLIKER